MTQAHPSRLGLTPIAMVLLEGLLYAQEAAGEALKATPALGVIVRGHHTKLHPIALKPYQQLMRRNRPSAGSCATNTGEQSRQPRQLVKVRRSVRGRFLLGQKRLPFFDRIEHSMTPPKKETCDGAGESSHT